MYRSYENPRALENELKQAQPEVLACGSGELVQESDDLVKDLVKDCISRQAAIDAVSKWFYDVCSITESDGTATIFKRLRDLPSAQPETHDKRTGTHECDLINRQQAIEAIQGRKRG